MGQIVIFERFSWFFGWGGDFVFSKGKPGSQYEVTTHVRDSPCNDEADTLMPKLAGTDSQLSSGQDRASHCSDGSGWQCSDLEQRLVAFHSTSFRTHGIIGGALRFGDFDLPCKQKIGKKKCLVQTSDIGEECRQFWA